MKVRELIKENPEIYKEIVLNVKAKEVAPDPEITKSIAENVILFLISEFEKKVDFLKVVNLLLKLKVRLI